jgi:predicted cupin superfamily sugar epimerase
MSRTPTNPEVAALGQRLSLVPHPEGGWYAETHRSAQVVRTSAHGERAGFTSILYLLEAGQVSRFHRLDAEELWNWHAGASLDIHVLTEGLAPMVRHLGPSAGESFQLVVPAGSWFGAEPVTPGTFCLVGCVVAPGFEFRTFEIAERQALLHRYAAASDAILRLT